MKHKLTSICLIAFLLFIMTACNGTTTTTPPGESSDLDPQGSGSASISGLHHATIEIRDYGTITVELDADKAPVTVENFLTLAESGFYDGLTIHRSMPGFVIQGGDPDGDGTGGSPETIIGEFSANGYTNTLSHTRGALSMARTAYDYDSASSQFFIVQQDAADVLDGQYAGFGYVTDGMDIVDKIVEQTPVADTDSGYILPENQPVIERVTVLD